MRGAALLLGALLLAGCDRPAAAPASPQGQPAAAAQAKRTDLPALTGRVVDGADLLTPEQGHNLTGRLTALEARTTDQLVVVTLRSLDGRPIEEVANALFNHWELGQAEKDNGVLLLVAPTERRTRIQVGFGLEPILTNARAAEIVDRDMLPSFQEGAFATGIEGGADAIARLLTAHEHEPRRGR